MEEMNESMHNSSMGVQGVLVSILIRAVSTLPLSMRVAMSRREAFAWASFFCCKVRNRWTESLRAHLPQNMPFCSYIIKHTVVGPWRQTSP